jgi:hypothetical protein
MLVEKFCMQNLHFLLDKLDKSMFHKNLDVLFSAYPYIHVGNTLLVDDMSYKNMFNGPYNAIFLESFNGHCGEDQYCWGLFSLIWKTFIRLNTVFPPLLNTIPLVGLDVLIEIIQDFLKCYFEM